MGFTKGSTQALDHMAKLRAMRGKNKSNQSTINNTYQPVQTTQSEAPPKSRGRFIKGSDEAKAYMASIRPSKR